MEQPIIARYCWTADDVVQGYCCNLWQSWRPVFRATFSAAIYFVALLCIVACIVDLGRGSALSAQFLVAPVFGLLWLLRLRLFRWVVRQLVAKRPAMNKEYEWEIASDKVVIRSPIARSEISWEAFVKVVQGPSGILLFAIDRTAYYIPRRGFASDAEFGQAIELTKSKVRTFRHVT
jgi:hypothetical protein